MNYYLRKKNEPTACYYFQVLDHKNVIFEDIFLDVTITDFHEKKSFIMSVFYNIMGDNKNEYNDISSFHDSDMIKLNSGEKVRFNKIGEHNINFGTNNKMKGILYELKSKY